MDTEEKWTLDNMESEHYIRPEPSRHKSKFDKLTLILGAALGLVVIGVLFYFLIGKKPSTTIASNIPVDNSPIEVPATVPDQSPPPNPIDSSIVTPAGPKQVLGASASANPTPAPTPTPTDSPTPTPTDSPTPTPTATPTPTPTPTNTPVPTPTPTDSPTPTPTPTSSPSASP